MKSGLLKASSNKFSACCPEQTDIRGRALGQELPLVPSSSPTSVLSGAVVARKEEPVMSGRLLLG